MKFDFSKESERKRFYNTYKWRGKYGVRNQVVERDKECLWCKDEGLVTLSNLEVDHIKELEYCTIEEAYSLDNLRLLC